MTREQCGRTYLVDEQHRVPARRELERALQVAVQLARARAQIAAADDEQGPAQMLARRFGGERFAHAGGTEEVNDEALALTTDEIVERRTALVELAVRLDERPKKRFALIRQHEARERFVVPVNRSDVAHVEFDCVTMLSEVFDHAEQQITYTTPCQRS